jgi:hypothetical protein
VLVSAGLRAWASRGVPTPWILPDETFYGLLGQGLYRDGHLQVLDGPTPYYSAVVPALAGLPLSLGDLVLGHSILKVLQAVVMSLAAVPVYLWGRSLMTHGWALVAAALTLAVPGLAYSGLVMSEVAFYPVLVLAAWAMAAALADPTPARQLLFLGATCLAVATRLQAVVLVPAFLTAVVLESLLARRRPRLARLALSLGGFALLATGWVVSRRGADDSLLAGYAEAGGRYDVGTAARFVAHHAGDLALLTGVVPVCALLLLLVRGLRSGEPDPHVRAFLAVAAGTALWLVVQVGVFASRELGLLAERNLFAAAPLAFLGFALWLDRGAPDRLRTRLLVGVAVAAIVIAVPLGDLLRTDDALPHAFTLILLHEAHAHIGMIQLGIGLAAVAAMLVPRRALPVLPAAVLLALAGASVAASRTVAEEARAQQARVVGPERRWVDAAASLPVAYVYDGQAYWTAVWETLFWNRKIRWVYDLPGAVVPGPLPQHPLEVEPDGELRPSGRASEAEYAISSVGRAFRGERVAGAPQLGTDREGLELWRLERPLRLSTVTSGLFANGDVDREATLMAYDCEGGAFEAVLLVKEPQTVHVLLDGRPVERRAFPGAETWRLRVPVPQGTGAGPCRLRVVPTGLLGTTRFAFERG